MNLTQAPLLKRIKIESVEDHTLEIKLMELGFSSNASFSMIRRAPFNGPLTLRNHKTQIIIRKEDAKQVLISHA